MSHQSTQTIVLPSKDDAMKPAAHIIDMQEGRNSPPQKARMQTMEVVDDSARSEPHGILRLTVKVPIPAHDAKQAARPASRWKTPEFMFYYIAFLVLVPMMVQIPVRLSQISHPAFFIYERKLSPGWLFGRHVDNSDRQYRSFRDNIPVLALLSLTELGISKIYALYSSQAASSSHSPPSRVAFLLPCSLVILLGLHGTGLTKILLILSLNYKIAKTLKASSVAPAATWIFNICVLFLNEIYDGYKFSWLHPSLEILDRMGGFYPRWNVIFNITMLRLISFNMDYYWACKSAASPSVVPEDEKRRVSTTHPLDTYTFLNYVSYALYPPLYIAGPIITFNNFMWQIRHPTNISARTIISYLARFLFCLMCMELVLHYMYVVAMKDTSAWMGRTPAEVAMIGFWNLIIVWLKLLIPWRFFRLWALADGIDPPENMIRCMANNYSTLGFWRAWHRSYNLWIIRYIYIPLGGTSNQILAFLLVFTFVALWHDLSLHLLAWGWLVTLFIIPELAAKHFFTAAKFGKMVWYRHVCAVGGVLNILMMMTANLVGFVIGTKGITHIATELFGTWQGVQFSLLACIGIFIAVQIMFEYREEEMRQGIHRRC